MVQAQASAVLLVAVIVSLWMPDVSAETKPIRIMPLGDSITAGSYGSFGYRYALWRRLRAERFNVDFVGSQREPLDSLPPRDFDPDHEGHSGWRVDQILVELKGWVASSQPDIVLVHVGHNDLLQDRSVASTARELRTLIDVLRQTNPRITILLAQLIASSHERLQTTIQLLNEAIAHLAVAASTTESRILLVDHHTGFNPANDTSEGVHPNEQGEAKMAEHWLLALRPLLGNVREAPTP